MFLQSGFFSGLLLDAARAIPPLLFFPPPPRVFLSDRIFFLPAKGNRDPCFVIHHLANLFPPFLYNTFFSPDQTVRGDMLPLSSSDACQRWIPPPFL